MADRSEIDEVRARIDIVSVVERYVTLKRSGGRLKGLCPFHQEKTPSFQVSPEIGRWYCFGQCSEGGDAIKFVQKIENLSFPEALERLALQANVTLSRQSGRPSAAPEISERDRIYRVNALALRFYREMLVRTPAAREYLEGRGLAYAAQEDFSIGFAPDEWESLCAYLVKHGAALADAEKAGLVSQGERGGYYDRLRGRLIFPIFDVQERPIAFGGRLIAEARPGQPKYWNSPETPVFSKSRTLYGLSRARKTIAAREQAIVVEGYTDVVAAHQAGFENVVATLGTSLTEEHVQILSRLASVVLLAFDADSAGLKAAGRAAQIFEAQEVEVRVLDLPAGEDPDSLLQGGKRQVFEKAIKEALPLTEYRLRRLIRKGPIESEQDKIALFRKALPILAAVPSAIEREQYVRLLAPFHPHYNTGTAFAEDHIRQDVAGYLTGRNQNRPAANAIRPALRPLPAGHGATERAERHLLRALAGGSPALAGQVLRELTPEEFVSDQARALALRLYAHYREKQSLDPTAIIASVGDDGLIDLVMQDDEPLTEQSLEGEIAHLKTRAKSERLSHLKAQINSGTADADATRQFELLFNELKGTPKIHESAV